MKIFLLGGSGMLGAVIQQLASRAKHEIVAPGSKLCNLANSVDIYEFGTGADVVINAAGKLGKDKPQESFATNSIGALNVATFAKAYDIPFIHISTDCVFSGWQPGWHTVEEVPDPIDVYGMSKRVGEILVQDEYPDASIIRTSFIGYKHGLLRWFLDNQDTCIEGYEGAIWSGSTVYEVARFVLALAQDFQPGIQHLATEIPVSKYEVLVELASVFKKNTDIKRVNMPVIYRGLAPTMCMADLKSSLPELVKYQKWA